MYFYCLCILKYTHCCSNGIVSVTFSDDNVVVNKVTFGFRQAAVDTGGL